MTLKHQNLDSGRDGDDPAKLGGPLVRLDAEIDAERDADRCAPSQDGRRTIR